MIDVKRAITLMASHSVDFVVIGGVALSLYSSAYVTYDIDFCFSRHRDNLRRISEALAPFNPRLRGFPKDLPFIWDEGSLSHGSVFTLETDIGEIDLLTEVTGLGVYADVLNESVTFDLFGFVVNVLSIDGLIRAKNASGREKDIPGLRILEAIREASLDEEDEY
ncbi:MAG: hypothetical protein ACR2M8_04895 [Pyrinomonadaceae bacterium]|nr:hypothetical protein [Blastocatellia bacterium]MDQ3490059.1 nucleotidyltransferase [Acidobacteriota bacterium]